MLVYPAPGLVVRDPATRRPVPAEGLEVSKHDTFWAALINCGDVTTTPPTEAPPTGAPQAPVGGAAADAQPPSSARAAAPVPAAFAAAPEAVTSASLAANPEGQA